MKDDCPRCGGSFPAHAFNGHPCVGRGEVHPDLAREIAELLPCHCRHAVGSDPPQHAVFCKSFDRPAVLAYVQRKLDEAKADWGLLAKVEAWCHQSGARITVTSAYPDPGAQRIRVRCGQGRSSTAPTLVEALRKLVEV